MINFEQKLAFRVHVTKVLQSVNFSELPKLLYNNRPYGKGNELFRLYTRNDRLLPFQVFIPTIEGATFDDTPQEWFLYNCDGQQVADLDTSQIDVKPVYSDGYYFIYKGDQQMTAFSNAVSGGGVFYFVIVTGNNRYVISEYFYVPENQTIFDKLLKIEWWHSCDIANVIYQTGYKNTLYLDATLMQNEPEIIEDGFENGFGQFVQTSAIYKDNYSLSHIVTEFISQAFLFMQLHQYIEITVPETGQKGAFQIRKVSTKWDSNGFWIELGVLLEQINVLFKASCCENKKWTSLISISAVDDVYMLNSNLYATPTNLPTTVNVLNNDIGDPSKIAVQETIQTNLGGIVTINSNGTLKYQKPASVGATFIDSFSYTIIDQYGSMSSANVTLKGGTVSGVNDKYYNLIGEDIYYPTEKVTNNDFIPVTHSSVVFPYIVVPNSTLVSGTTYKQFDNDGTINYMELDINTGSVVFYNPLGKSAGDDPDVYSYQLKTNNSGGLTPLIIIEVFYE